MSADHKLPTPPSDAGTSERETGIPPTCEHCGHLTDSEPISFSLTFGDRVYPMTCNHAVAPAAEGPREETWWSVEAQSARIAAARAALPGAEAGTPDLAELERIARANGYWNYIAPFAECLAALTSEVRALREERDAAMADVARLTKNGEKNLALLAASDDENDQLRAKVAGLQRENARLSSNIRAHRSWGKPL